MATPISNLKLQIYQVLIYRLSQPNGVTGVEYQVSSQNSNAYVFPIGQLEILLVLFYHMYQIGN